MKEDNNMNYFEDACKVMETQLGKDTVIALATHSEDGIFVSNVDTYYKDGCLYTITSLDTYRMKNIVKESSVAFCRSFNPSEPIYYALMEGHGEAKEIGSIMGHKMQEELKNVFSAFYDEDVEEDNPRVIVLETKIEFVVVFDGEYKYAINYKTKTAERIDCKIV